MEILLSLSPLHIAVVSDAKLTFLRLGNARTLRGEYRLIASNDHLTFMENIDKILSGGIPSDTVDIRARNEWEYTSLDIEKDPILRYTDHSKTTSGFVSKFYRRKANVSNPIGKYLIAFHAEFGA